MTTNSFSGRPEIVLRASAGATVANCIREAIILAMKEDYIVKFIHNQVEVTINPDQVIEPIYKDWEERHP